MTSFYGRIHVGRLTAKNGGFRPGQFIMMSAFLLLNLFIGVITASMEDAKEEMYRRKKENARLALSLRLRGKVRKTPSWARSWANFNHLQLCSLRNARANRHLVGRPS